MSTHGRRTMTKKKASDKSSNAADERKIYAKRRNPKRFPVTEHLSKINNRDLLRRMYTASGGKTVYLEQSRAAKWKSTNRIPYEHVITFCQVEDIDAIKWWPELFPKDPFTLSNEKN